MTDVTKLSDDELLAALRRHQRGADLRALLAEADKRGLLTPGWLTT